MGLFRLVGYLFVLCLVFGLLQEAYVLTLVISKYLRNTLELSWKPHVPEYRDIKDFRLSGLLDDAERQWWADLPARIIVTVSYEIARSVLRLVFSVLVEFIGVLSLTVVFAINSIGHPLYHLLVWLGQSLGALGVELGVLRFQ